MCVWRGKVSKFVEWIQARYLGRSSKCCKLSVSRDLTEVLSPISSRWSSRRPWPIPLKQRSNGRFNRLTASRTQPRYPPLHFSSLFRFDSRCQGTRLLSSRKIIGSIDSIHPFLLFFSFRMILRFQSDSDFEQHARLKFPINLIRVKDTQFGNLPIREKNALFIGTLFIDTRINVYR